MIYRERNRNERTRRAAFTLMEIIVVVAIILILAGSGVFVYMNVLGDANVSRAKLDVKSIEKAVMTYKVKHGAYPGSLEVLAARQDDGSPAYLTPEALTDPWGRPYQYNPASTHPTTDMPLIYSDGPPERPQQINNWGK